MGRKKTLTITQAKQRKIFKYLEQSIENAMKGIFALKDYACEIENITIDGGRVNIEGNYWQLGHNSRSGNSFNIDTSDRNNVDYDQVPHCCGMSEATDVNFDIGSQILDEMRWRNPSKDLINAFEELNVLISAAVLFDVLQNTSCLIFTDTVDNKSTIEGFELLYNLGVPTTGTVYWKNHGSKNNLFTGYLYKTLQIEV